MKFRAERTEFDDAIKWVQRTVGDRVSFPAMAGIKMSLEADELTLSSTNGQIDSELTIKVTGDRDGALLVSGKLLSSVVHVLPNDAVTLDSQGDGLTISCGRSRFELRTMTVEDFPALRTPPEDAPTAMLKAGEFSKLISQVAPSASNEDARPVLTGVKLEATQGTFTAAATDSYRLAVRTMPWDDMGEMSALVPKAALQQARHAADMLGSEVVLSLGPGYASFRFADRRLICSLIEGQYPAYRGLLPPGHEQELRVNRQDLTEVARRIAVVGQAESTMTPIVLSMGGDSLTVQADSAEAGEAQESLQVEYDGDPLEIAFNPDFLIAGLDAVGTEHVQVEFNGEVKPAVLRAPAPEEGDDVPETDFLYLLMPVRR